MTGTAIMVAFRPVLPTARSDNPITVREEGRAHATSAPRVRVRAPNSARREVDNITPVGSSGKIGTAEDGVLEWAMG